MIFREGRKPQACKPDSVPVPESAGGHHLSVPDVSEGDRAAYPSPNPFPEAWTSRPWPQSRGMGAGDIRGISARKVYPPVSSPGQDVGSYPTFSPLPPRKRRRSFSVALSVPAEAGPGCSPVRCPMLSGLSSIRASTDRDGPACGLNRKALRARMRM